MIHKLSLASSGLIVRWANGAVPRSFAGDNVSRTSGFSVRAICQWLDAMNRSMKQAHLKQMTELLVRRCSMATPVVQLITFFAVTSISRFCMHAKLESFRIAGSPEGKQAEVEVARSLQSRHVQTSAGIFSALLCRSVTCEHRQHDFRWCRRPSRAVAVSVRSSYTCCCEAHDLS